MLFLEMMKKKAELQFLLLFFGGINNKSSFEIQFFADGAVKR